LAEGVTVFVPQKWGNPLKYQDFGRVFCSEKLWGESLQVQLGNQGESEHRKRKAPQPVTQAMGTSKKGGEKVIILTAEIMPDP
jgi:hypothetical protein